MSLNPDEQAFFRAMEAAYTDDLPRLVYADWLEERGDSDRAEFIRLQVAAKATRSTDDRKALEQQADGILKQHFTEWTAGLPEWAVNCAWRNGFRRGFPVLYFPSARHFLNSAGQIRERMPLIEVDFKAIGELGEQLFASEHFRALRVIYLSRDDASSLEEEILTLAASKQAQQVVKLVIAGDTLSREDLTDESAYALAKMSNLPCLKSFCFPEHDNVTIAGLRAIVESERLTGLRELDLHGERSFIESRELCETFRSEKCQLRQLRSLNLWGYAFGDEGASLLAESPHFGHLEELDLSYTELTGVGVLTLVRSPSLKSVRKLLVSGEQLQLTDSLAKAILADGRDWMHVEIGRRELVSKPG